MGGDGLHAIGIREEIEYEYIQRRSPASEVTNLALDSAGLKIGVAPLLSEVPQRSGPRLADSRMFR